MAAAVQIVGMAIGAYFGGPAGAALGSTIGGLVGNELFPQKLEGPRLQDLSLTTSSYGSPLSIVYGRDTRVSGSVIWSTGLHERKTSRRAGKGGGAKIAEYHYSTSCAVLLSQGARAPGQRGCKNIRRIWANKKLIWDRDTPLPPGWPPIPMPDYEPWAVERSGMSFKNDPPPVDDPMLPWYSAPPLRRLAFWPGTFEQGPDPSIQATLGMDNTPAYVGSCYIVLTDLELADFGNALPNIEVELEGLDTPSVGHVLRDICERSGLLVDEYSVHPSLYARALRGYPVARAGSAIAAITPLLAAYAIDATEQGGTVRFVPRGLGPVAAIPVGDMGARQPDATPTPPVQLESLAEHDMPAEAVINYYDPERDYQTGSQRTYRTGTTAQTKVSVDLPMVFSADEARRIVDRVLWEPWVSRVTARFSVTRRWQHLRPGDVVTIPVAGYVVPVRLTQLTTGHNGVIACEATVDDPYIYEGSTAGDVAFVPANNVRFNGPTVGYVFDAPLLLPTSSDTGIYYGLDSEAAGWRGGTLLRSVDNGVSYGEVELFSTRTVMGLVTHAPGVGAVDYWDEVNTVEVTLFYGDAELSSATLLQVLAGYNAAWIGAPDGSIGEVIQFADAQLMPGPGRRYQLSTLLRGRRGSEYAMGVHAPGSIFVLLEADYLREMDRGIGDWDRVRAYVALSLGQPLDDDVPVQEIANTGERARPRAPVHGRGVRDGGDNLTISWVRRSRLYTPGLGRGPAPLGEAAEAYEIDVVVGGDVVRTLTSAMQSVVYDAAQQAADGIAPGGPVSVRIYQMSATRGRGHAGEFTL